MTQKQSRFCVTPRNQTARSLQHRSGPLAPRISTDLPGPHGAPYRGLRPPPPTPRATTGPGEHFPAMYRCLHGPHMQLAVPSFPPRGPRALLCPETPPAMKAREGHHMRQDRLGPKQGKGALGGHLCGVGRERGKAGSDGEEQQTRTGRAGGQEHVRCLVIRKTESRPAT